jgi:hypothetical protein
VTVARRVAPGREGEFEDWAGELTAAASHFPGFLGAGLLRPGFVGEDWHVVYRFETPERLAAWEESPRRAELLARGEHLMDTTGVQRVTGLETWFELPGRTAPAPPRRRMFVVSLLGYYPVQLVVYLTLGVLTARWPLPLRLAVLVPVVAALMTWFVMPQLARLFAGWLYSSPRSRHRA